MSQAQILALSLTRYLTMDKLLILCTSVAPSVKWGQNITNNTGFCELTRSLQLWLIQNLSVQKILTVIKTFPLTKMTILVNAKCKKYVTTII